MKKRGSIDHATFIGYNRALIVWEKLLAKRMKINQTLIGSSSDGQIDMAYHI